MAGSLVGRPVPGPVDRHHRARGRRADLVGVPPRAGGSPSRRQPRDRPRRSGRAVREQGLRLGRDGHQHPAPSGRQPGRTARDGRAHHPRARIHATPGLRAGGGGQAVGVRAGRPAAALPDLPDAHQVGLRRGPVHPPPWLADAGRRRGHPRRRRASGCRASSRWRSNRDHALHHGRPARLRVPRAGRLRAAQRCRHVDRRDPLDRAHRGHDQRAARADRRARQDVQRACARPTAEQVRGHRPAVSPAPTAPSASVTSSTSPATRRAGRSSGC